MPVKYEFGLLVDILYDNEIIINDFDIKKDVKVFFINNNHEVYLKDTKITVP